MARRPRNIAEAVSAGTSANTANYAGSSGEGGRLARLKAPGEEGAFPFAGGGYVPGAAPPATYAGTGAPAPVILGRGEQPVVMGSAPPLVDEDGNVIPPPPPNYSLMDVLSAVNNANRLFGGGNRFTVGDTIAELAGNALGPEASAAAMENLGIPAGSSIGSNMTFGAAGSRQLPGGGYDMLGDTVTGTPGISDITTTTGGNGSNLDLSAIPQNNAYGYNSSGRYVPVSEGGMYSANGSLINPFTIGSGFGSLSSGAIGVNTAQAAGMAGGSGVPLAAINPSMVSGAAGGVAANPMLGAGIGAGIMALIGLSAAHDAKQQAKAYENFTDLLQGEHQWDTLGHSGKSYYANDAANRAYLSGATPETYGIGGLGTIGWGALNENPYVDGKIQHTGGLSRQFGVGGKADISDNALQNGRFGVLEFKGVNDQAGNVDYLRQVYDPIQQWEAMMEDAWRKQGGSGLKMDRIADNQQEEFLRFMGNNPPPGYDQYRWYSSENGGGGETRKVKLGEEAPRGWYEMSGALNPDLNAYLYANIGYDGQNMLNDRGERVGSLINPDLYAPDQNSIAGTLKSNRPKNVTMGGSQAGAKNQNGVPSNGGAFAGSNVQELTRNRPKNALDYGSWLRSEGKDPAKVSDFESGKSLYANYLNTV